jgi:hypothetical protein
VGIALFLVALFALPARPDKYRPFPSSTRAFSIDGNRYRIEKAAGSEFSTIRRELLVRGIDVPIPCDEKAANPLFEDAAREDLDGAPIPPIPLPKCLHAEHFMNLESEAGPIGIVLGTTDGRSSQIRRNLSAAGWEFIAPETDGAPVAVATTKKGRESLVVLLEEKKGNFLLVRKMD